jgi:D-methionine transport system substrate-binding protein
LLKKICALVVCLVLVFSLAACSSTKPENEPQKDQTSEPNQQKAEKTVIKVGASPVPHAEILEVAKEVIAADGIELEIIPFQDYVQPNLALDEGDLDANYFQHIPYLESFSKEHNLQLISVAGVHIEPMGVYSSKIKDLTQIEDGSRVAIPNDVTNGGRALLLLEKAGIIKLNPDAGIEATINDVVENPKNIKINELEAAMLPNVLQDVEIAVINTNYALDAGFNPTQDALFIEDSDSPYVNILVARQGDENRPEIKKLAEALQSDEVKSFISEQYKGAVVAAF